MSYDHHTKAGNQGDVVKHVALIAALDAMLRDDDLKESDAFRYADTFAGYAYSPLVDGNEWERGVGKLPEKHKMLCSNPHCKLWWEWYLQGRPKLVGGVYPGSSMIASDLCRFHHKDPKLALWDTSPSVVANLMETFRGQGHQLFPRPACPHEPAVRHADFLLIDPPGASMTRSTTNPLWAQLAEFLENRRRATLVWLPVLFNKQKGERVEVTRLQREDALKRGLSVSVVRWSDLGIRQPVGCQLFYRLPDQAHAALQAAIQHVAGIMNWQDALSSEIEAVTHLQPKCP